jgi:hypothetical protein
MLRIASVFLPHRSPDPIDVAVGPCSASGWDAVCDGLWGQWR